MASSGIGAGLLGMRTDSRYWSFGSSRRNAALCSRSNRSKERKCSAVGATQQQLQQQEQQQQLLREESVSSLLDEVSVVPSCPVPDFSPALNAVTLLNPLKVMSSQLPPTDGLQQKPLLVYVPGMDCTGQGIRRQLPSLAAAGYDVRCVYIPSSDRSSWKSLVSVLIPLLKKEIKTTKKLILVGESFGGRLALHLAKAAGDLVSKLVLVNPATNFTESNRIGSLLGQTGILGILPESLYELAQDILLPFLVKKNRVSLEKDEDLLSPIDFVPADCVAWRLSMLNDQSGLFNQEIRSIKTPTLILASAKDRLLSSLEEGIRLQNLLPNAKRIILPDSGHIALLEDAVDLAALIEEHRFSPSETKPQISDDVMDELGRLLGPWRLLTSPLVSGGENLPSPALAQGRPVLFVGNHTTFGVYDTAILVHELYLRGFKCRGLAHPGHWLTGVGQIFERYGSVKATTFEAYRLLKDGENVLLFPGGAREVNKPKGQEYKLRWKSTTDFVRMAIRLNAIIVPFGALGGDDAFKVLFDSEDILNSFLGDYVRQLYSFLKLDAENVQPISAFPFTNLPSPIPLPYSIERIYFHFAECVDTLEVQTDVRNREECYNLYLLVKDRVEKSILRLQKSRAMDPERELRDRLFAKLQRVLPSRQSIRASSLN